jgi:DNA-binding protein HU-beta
MTKAETISQVTDLTGVQQEKVNNVVLELLECIINALAAHEAVFVKDFGTFHCKLRNQTTGRNIRENKTVILPAHHIPFFKPYNDFKAQMKHMRQSV